MRHIHAFKLVMYKGTEMDTWEEREVLWNARDEEAPAFIIGRSGNELMREDGGEYAPNHVPMIGDRIFVELTDERALVLAEQQVKAERRDPEQRAELDYQFATREEAVRETASAMLDARTADIRVVDEAYLKALATKRPQQISEEQQRTFAARVAARLRRTERS